RQTPPGARPNRGGTPGNRQRCFRVAARVGRARRSVTGVPEEWPSIAARRGQNPAYRPSDLLLRPCKRDHLTVVSSSEGQALKVVQPFWTAAAASRITPMTTS